MNSVYTGIYRLDIRNHNSDVAHLYEHLLIRSFENHISHKGFSPFLYGWFHGETFRDICFLEYGFYSVEVRDLFVRFMGSNNRIDINLLDNEIERVEAEDRSLTEIKDKQEVIEALKRIDKEVWINAETSAREIEQIRKDSEQRDISVMRLKKSAKSFRDVSIMIGVQDASLEEKALMLRSLPIIYDALARLTYELGFYERDSSPLRYQEEYDAMVACMIFTVRRGTYNVKDLEGKARRIVSSISLTGHEKELLRYKEAYVQTSLWNTFPIEYYKYSGMLVSKEQIAKLLTTENIHHLLQKLTIKVVPTTEAHYENCRD